MKTNFCSLALVGAACVGAGLVVTAATGQSGGDSAEAHIEAARRAAGSEYLPVLQWPLRITDATAGVTTGPGSHISARVIGGSTSEGPVACRAHEGVR